MIRPLPNCDTKAEEELPELGAVGEGGLDLGDLDLDLEGEL